MSDKPAKRYGGPVPGQPRKPVKDIGNLPEEFLRECLRYNPATGILWWKHRPDHHFPHPHQAAVWNALFAGKQAGSKKCRKRSYKRSTIQICISTIIPEEQRVPDHQGRVRRTKSILYSAHRLAYTLMGQTVPVDMVIDHINNDPWDNRWENLRLLTQRENCRNRGASYHKKSKLPRNIFCVRGEYAVKMTVGTYKTVEEALAARNSAEVAVFGKVCHREDQ